MTRGEIWKDFLKHTVLTLVIALALLRDSLWDSEDVCLAGSPWI